MQQQQPIRGFFTAFRMTASVGWGVELERRRTRSATASASAKATRVGGGKGSGSMGWWRPSGSFGYASG
jgi:hypothetical protein